MPPAHIRYDVADGVATLTLDRPEAMNAFGGTMREDLKEARASLLAKPEHERLTKQVAALE